MDERAWPDELTCRRQVFRWLTRYNTVRRHSYCDNLPPNTYENHRCTRTTGVPHVKVPAKLVGASFRTARETGRL
ncbi:hypothetical protein DRB07_01470 [Actinomyces sp. Z3]|nr:hypothetical protein DRB07_01470 [Actinomyces sp. Z3]